MVDEHLLGNPELESGEVSIIAFRHGPTTWNREGRIQGNIQNDILPDYIDDYLRNIGADRLAKPDAFIVSNLTRTTQTAEALIRLNNWTAVPFIKDARFNEKKWGIFEGLTDAVARQRVIDEPSLRPDFPHVATLEDVAGIWEHPHFKVPGGESSAEVRKRMMEGLASLTMQHAGKRLIMVSHAGALISLGFNHHVITRFKIRPSGERITIDTFEPQP